MTPATTRHITYSRAYLGAAVDVSLPEKSGRAHKTIETRKLKYGSKTMTAKAVENARNQDGTQT